MTLVFSRCVHFLKLQPSNPVAISQQGRATAGTQGVRVLRVTAARGAISGYGREEKTGAADIFFRGSARLESRPRGGH